MKLISKSMLKTAMMSIGFACAVTQVSAAEIIPHRGLWKHYTGSDVAENSVSSYVRAKDKGAKFVEIDLRMARIHDADRVIVFHDFYWDRGVKYDSNGDDWGHKKFINQNPTTHAITQNTSLATFNNYKLKRNGGNGYQRITDDKPLLLNQFLLETICKYQNGPNIILDVQSIDIATQAASIIGNGLCPTVGNSRLKYSSKVSMKLFPHSTTPASIIAGTPRAEDIPARVVHHYNRHTNNFKIYFQFNSGSFDSSTCNNPFNDCQLKLRDGLTERNVSMAEFRNQIMLLNDVAGVALSAPPIHTDTSSTYRAAINNTMNRQLSWFNSNKNGKKLISIASRPDDRKLYTTRGLNGSQQNEERCFMYNYNGDNSGRISLYVSSVYSNRNAYANNPEFDYIIADAYINGANLDWDEALEVELLCGGNKSIIHSFRKKGGETAAQSANDYKNLTWEQDREYYYLLDLKGRSQIEQYYSKK